MNRKGARISQRTRHKMRQFGAHVHEDALRPQDDAFRLRL